MRSLWSSRPAGAAAATLGELGFNEVRFYQDSPRR
jgi:hypothetical protein